MINTWNPAEIGEALNKLEHSIDIATEAESISYDNTTSGLTADDVQDAIDEIEGRVDTLETRPVISRATTTVTTNASGAASVSASDAPLAKTITIDIISPTGYYLEIYRGSSTYGVEVKDKGTDEPLASSDVELEIWKVN